MNLRKIPFKKPAKLLILLLSSMVIATTSAALYSQMFMYSHVTVQAHYCRFVAAANTTDVNGTVTPGGEEVTFANMIGCNGSLVTYVAAVNITNAYNASRNIELKLDNWDGEFTTTLRYINVTMYEGNTKQGAMLTLVPGLGGVTTSGQVNIPSSGMWRVQWDVYWWGNATLPNTADVKLVLIER